MIQRGIIPENLPPAEDVKKVERRLVSEEKKALINKNKKEIINMNCIYWSQIDKTEYLSAMRESVSDSTHIKALVQPTLTTKIDDREMFMKWH